MNRAADCPWNAGTSQSPCAREAPEFARARQPEAAIFSRGARQKSGSHQAAAFGGRIGGVQQALVQRNAGFHRATGLDDEGRADKNRSLRQRRDGVGIAAQGLDRARRGGFARRGGVVRPFARCGDGVGVADDPRQPLVALIFERRLARFDQAEFARHELHHPPPRRIAAHQCVEIVLELADLINRPFLRQGGEGVGGRAGAVVVERRGNQVSRRSSLRRRRATCEAA